jgi:hypothetical protein
VIIHRRATTPLYLPSLSKTTKTGGIFSLNSEKQLESVPSSRTLAKPLEKTSFTVFKLKVSLFFISYPQYEFKPII